MPYIIRCYVGRLRMLNWESGDTGPKITQLKRPSLIKSLMQIKESAKYG